MRLSRLLGNRYKEAPSEAVLPSHVLLLRGGYVRPAGDGGYGLLAPGQRVLENLRTLFRAEFDGLGGQELRLPAPSAPPEEQAGEFEWATRLLDRAEAAAALCRHEIRSHAQLPALTYEFHQGARGKARAREGLFAARELSCVAAFLFHAPGEEPAGPLRTVREACERVFARAGLPAITAAETYAGAPPGAMALVFLCDRGAEQLAVCDSCSYRAMADTARARFTAYPETPLPLEEVHTPGMKTIEAVAGYLGVPPRRTAKVVFYESDAEGRPVVLLIRGDLNANEAKVARLIGVTPAPAREATIAALGAAPGFATPMGLDRSRFRLLVDATVTESGNLVCGANRPDYHLLHFNCARDLPGVPTVDVANAPDGAGCPACEGTLRLRRGWTLGTVVTAGSLCTERGGMVFSDAEDRPRTPQMACAMVGLDPLLSSIVEAHHDDCGPLWSLSIAPWRVHLNALKLDDGAVRQIAEGLYAALQAAGVEALYDDRNASPGVQFADADLLGAPIRLIVSPRNLANGQVEYKRRDLGETGSLPLEKAQSVVQQWLSRT